MRHGFNVLVLSFLAFLGHEIFAGDYINEIFVPVGYDYNDEVLVVIDGYLPSNCYKADHPLVDKSKLYTEQKITIEAVIRESRIEPCIPALVPFSRVVNLGVIKRGDYVVYANAERIKSNLNVAATFKFDLMRSAFA